ncbi:MAG: carboxypeptidase regulatory-like domain-containing protein [Candidatus Acidiferrales bacterium]
MKEQGNSFHRTHILGGLSGVVRALLCAMLAMLCTAFVAKAQDTGYISGTVTDKTGAAVAGADVVISSTTGSATHATTTNGDGAYVVAGLPGGTYDIVVTAKGFQKFTAQNVVLAVGQKIRVDVSLTVGTVTEEVVVTGESVAQVETTSSEMGSTITGKQINQLILNGRNFTQLVNLSPGVVDQTGSDEGKVGVYGNVAYSMNGGRTEYNNWELDGGDNMDNGSNSTLNVYPNPEAIAEFKVLTSNYGAQYGRNASGTVEVETKSGGRTFHGSAFYYGRNEFFNARGWSEGQDPTAPKAQYRKHDWGYTLGGPVYIPNHYNTDKKKTFFFWSQEWRRQSDPTTINVNVPSDAERGGNFSDVCSPTPGAIDPVNYPDCPVIPGTTSRYPNDTLTSISPDAQYFLALIPKANATNGGFPSTQSTVSLPTTWREELIRVDHNITDNYRLTFRYIHDSWSTVVPNPLWGNGSSFTNVNTNFVGPGTSFVARLNANFSPTLLNEFVASYTADHIFLNAVGPVGLPSGYTGGSLFSNNFDNKLPSFTIDNGNAYGGGFSVDTGYFPWKNANPTYTYRDNVTKVLGNHTLQFGAYFAAAQKNQQNSLYTQGVLDFNNSSPVSTGNAFADLLVGNIAGYTQADHMILFYDRYKILEPYFQDDWRVTKKFTLNLGLRWSIFGRYQERYNNEFGLNPALWSSANAPQLDTNGSQTGSVGAIIPGSGNQFNGFEQCGVAPAPTGCLNNKYMNPAPRFGFAWDPKGDGKMAIRGGYGIFFEHENGNEANAESLQQGASPKILISTQNNVVGYENIGGGGAAPSFPINPFSIPNKAAWPYVQQWNLDVQKELPSHFVVTVAYVGSKGTHLVNQRDINQLTLYTGANPFAPGQMIDAQIPGTGTGSGNPAQFYDDCANIVGANGLPDPNATLGNGTPVPAGALNNLFVACGNTTNLVRPFYPGYGTVNRIETSANSIYHALQVTANHSFGALTLSVAYTYSHSIDDSSDRYDGGFTDSYNLPLSRASSNFDQRQSLAVSYVYQIPYKGSGWSKVALGDWQVSGITVVQTGTPFSITNDSGFSDSAGLGNGNGTASRPDLVGNPFMSSQNVPGERGPLYYNPAAFAVPTGLTYGNVGRNTLRYPGRTNFNFGLFKRFPIKEKGLIEFRWENFNLFNHTQYNSIGTSMDTINPGDNQASSGFLHLNGTHDARIMQFGLRLQF